MSSDVVQRLRKSAKDLLLAAPGCSEPSASLYRDQASACLAGADAIAKLSSPDYVVVKREAAEKALEKAEESGYDYMRMGLDNLTARTRELQENSVACMKEARSLLGLSDSEGT